MRINFFIIVSIVLAVGLVVVAFTMWQAGQERHRLTVDLERRTALLAEGMQDGVQGLMVRGNFRKLQQLVDKHGSSQRILGLAVFNAHDSLLSATTGGEVFLPDARGLVSASMDSDSAQGSFAKSSQRQLYFYALPLKREDAVIGALAVFSDAGNISQAVRDLWERNFLRLLIQALVISAVTLLVIQWSVFGPLNRMVEWMKTVRFDQYRGAKARPPEGFFSPLQKEVGRMAQSILEARASAAEEARLRVAAESLWTPERLKQEAIQLLGDRLLVAVSNREPYVHSKRGRSIEVQVPASGLVTAMEPVLKACGGVWVAHGSGSADRETVDSRDRLAVPPEEPSYTLRRLWLSKEEEEGYYYGFANEGLWPLCHIAHARPTFRETDWRHYQQVNQKFAETILDEIEGTQEPYILVQDYHFALLPRLIKERRPDARVAVFWHIPWPNPEAFRICPWERELIYGMLGADVIGFHIQYHCNNFLETVDRSLECRIDWERFSVEKDGHHSLVKPFPISIAYKQAEAPEGFDRAGLKESLLKEHGVKSEFMGVGVDRIDYTKGIPERFRAVERFLEKYPDYRERFTFVELGAPSRTHIKRYHDLVTEVEGEAERINWRFKTRDWRPIVLLAQHHSHRQILPFYQGADLCMVTSLHDGMNLVAKEYVASRVDGTGSLILSRFTGASRELLDALIVNPYDVEQMADAVRFALEMPEDEQKLRMERMQQQVLNRNIYLWAVRLIRALHEVRIGAQPTWENAGADDETKGRPAV
ncbi:MAG TPA: trehalose-6-phosphate synthase [candidate division Zixibacteria bacterium]|jgi:trehalose 6-phosphate synthase|nr:trehalose-6-phosphate synthase [candidate division Zixibacteria bacterium]